MGVTGIGGVFFRSDDPEALRDWYTYHLGFPPEGSPVWPQEEGPVVFMPFDRDSDYFPAERQFMLNLRVTDLDGLLASLRASGIEVITDPEWDTPETGRFARIHDPEGNPIELWELPEEAGDQSDEDSTAA